MSEQESDRVRPSQPAPPARRSRRVRREGAPGTDPTPRLPERDRGEGSWSSNDDQLKRDVPPHY